MCRTAKELGGEAHEHTGSMACRGHAKISRRRGRRGWASALHESRAEGIEKRAGGPGDQRRVGWLERSSRAAGAGISCGRTCWRYLSRAVAQPSVGGRRFNAAIAKHLNSRAFADYLIVL